MALNPGSIQGEEVQVGSKTYVWDGVKWTIKSKNAGIKTLDVELSNPITYRSGRLNTGPDGYPEGQGLTTQSGANEYLLTATDWLKLHKSEVIIQSGLPDKDEYNDGALWVDIDTFDMFVLSGDQWIDLTALPDMTDYVKDSDLQFALGEYLRKQEAANVYYPFEKLVHFIKPNGSFKLHLGDGAELDNIFTRLIDAERNIIHIQDQIDNLGGDGETPPDANHPGGQYILSGGISSAVSPGYWAFAWDGIQYWNQINTFYISETDLEGDNILWNNHVGEFIQVHRYDGNPYTGADYSCSAVYRISSVNDLGTYNTLNVSLQTGTDKGVLGVGEYFTFEVIDEGTF